MWTNIITRVVRTEPVSSAESRDPATWLMRLSACPAWLNVSQILSLLVTSQSFQEMSQWPPAASQKPSFSPQPPVPAPWNQPPLQPCLLLLASCLQPTLQPCLQHLLSADFWIATRCFGATQKQRKNISEYTRTEGLQSPWVQALFSFFFASLSCKLSQSQWCPWVNLTQMPGNWFFASQVSPSRVHITHYYYGARCVLWLWAVVVERVADSGCPSFHVCCHNLPPAGHRHEFHWSTSCSVIQATSLK